MSGTPPARIDGTRETRGEVFREAQLRAFPDAERIDVATCGMVQAHPRVAQLRVVDEQLQALAGELERSHPGAAASLREGLEETLTVTRLGVRGALKKTLQSTTRASR